jgi:hypothetical protein
MQKNIFRIFIYSVMLCCSVAIAQEDNNAEPVEYVKICSLYGAEYYYVPGTDVCTNAYTGVTQYQTDQGTVTSETPLAARVRALEDTVEQLELMLYGGKLPNQE